ncbi:MAG: hypothetical protein JZD41_02255 [Thermoproteus sp.]|nr:hypothetical protein [Thermoproteus sp.]
MTKYLAWFDTEGYFTPAIYISVPDRIKHETSILLDKLTRVLRDMGYKVERFGEYIMFEGPGATGKCVGTVYNETVKTPVAKEVNTKFFFFFIKTKVTLDYVDTAYPHGAIECEISGPDAEKIIGKIKEWTFIHVTSSPP